LKAPTKRARFPHLPLLLTAACLTTLAPHSAAAYCRASDEHGSHGECVPEPDAPLLHWDRACVAYRFNKDAFNQLKPLAEAEVRGAFTKAFAAWAEVDCSGRAPFFVEQLAGTTATDKSGFLRDKPNEMVVLAVEPEAWSQLADHSSAAIALTLMWHDTKTGEVYDTDMELNLGAGKFSDCVSTSCGAGMIDLQNTITHEAGHVLGLGHSTDPESTMAPQARGKTDVQKRTLAPDDEAGYCALELPSWKCTGSACTCPAPPIVPPQTIMTTSPAGCQVTHASTRPRSLWLLLTAAGLLLRLARRRAAHEA
jgi:hypothetical protein